jgi:hypothetical protein
MGAGDLAAKILDRHLGGLERPLAAEIGVDAGLVVENADLDLAVGNFRECGAGGGHQQGGRHHICQFHEYVLPNGQP